MTELATVCYSGGSKLGDEMAANVSLTPLAKLATLKGDLAVGIAQLDAGEGRKVDAQEIKRQGRRLLANASPGA